MGDKPTKANLECADVIILRNRLLTRQCGGCYVTILPYQSILLNGWRGSLRKKAKDPAIERMKQ